jgi:tripartite-type tricarboxylate transporter receptor subunit TctC
VAKGDPDGHTIMMYASAFTVAPLINPGVLDPKDLTPVATVATIPTVLIVSAEKPYKSVAELVAAAKAKPGDIVGTTAGIGSFTHMNLERFRIAAGIEVLRLHLKGAPEAFTEVMTGRADFYFALPFQVRANLKSGKIRALAVGSPKRSSLFPDLPTTVEAGYPNSDYNAWVGALVPTKTPREIVQRLHREFNAAVNAPDVREKIVKTGADPLSLTLTEFEAMIAAEFESNGRLIKAANIKAN